jgi:hypothetical protein
MYLDTTTETEIPNDDFGPWNGHQVVLVCDSLVLDITT